MITKLELFKMGEFGIHFDNIVDFNKLLLLLNENDFKNYNVTSTIAYFNDGILYTDEVSCPKESIISINDLLLDNLELDKKLHSLTLKEKFEKGLATVTLDEDELESVILKNHYQLSDYVKNFPYPEALNLILINNELFSYYEKISEVIFLDLIS